MKFIKLLFFKSKKTFVDKKKIEREFSLSTCSVFIQFCVIFCHFMFLNNS